MQAEMAGIQVGNRKTSIQVGNILAASLSGKASQQTPQNSALKLKGNAAPVSAQMRLLETAHGQYSGAQTGRPERWPPVKCACSKLKTPHVLEMIVRVQIHEYLTALKLRVTAQTQQEWAADS